MCWDRAGIPQEWLTTLSDRPRRVPWMERLGMQLTSAIQSDSAEGPIRLPALGLLFRNLFFLFVVLYHGLRRWLFNVVD